MGKMDDALQVSGFDPEAVDLDLLIGWFALLKKWSVAEHHLLALGKKSLCGEIRDNGRRLRMKLEGGHEHDTQ
ncbi:hypothetical protein [Candidatus Igneacidithiobacillus taiwanensis]|uniref:hypothetical protein n=1 Tax=Candidatus Igneacidithiobacillus taiwanensis TaxID=1945924 RepID=UPI00289DFCD0|nr:hypothetical protein [Candidatus Igneacidithiobacillus taiwanensis]